MDIASKLFIIIPVLIWLLIWLYANRIGVKLFCPNCGQRQIGMSTQCPRCVVVFKEWKE